MKRIIVLSLILSIAFSISYPLFHQCDSRWGSHRLGTSSNTICSAGCLMSSVSMVLNGKGAKIDGQDPTPDTLNTWLTNHGGYVSGDLFVWSAVDTYGLSFITNSASASQAVSYFDQGKVVILNVRGGSHWVLMTGHSGNTLNVNDPGFDVSSYSMGDVVGAGVYSIVGDEKQLELLQATAVCGSCPDIKTMVSQAEGYRTCVYKDSLGIPTIGIGFNLQRSDARSKITAVGANYDKVLAGSQCLSDSQIDSLFQGDLATSKSGAQKCVSSFNSQPTCVQNVVIDMSFNMGPAALCSWPNFVSQLGKGDYQGAAANMKSTKWCGQVGTRCTRDTNIIASCK